MYENKVKRLEKLVLHLKKTIKNNENRENSLMRDLAEIEKNYEKIKHEFNRQEIALKKYKENEEKSIKNLIEQKLLFEKEQKLFEDNKKALTNLTRELQENKIKEKNTEESTKKLKIEKEEVEKRLKIIEERSEENLRVIDKLRTTLAPFFTFTPKST